MNILHHKSWHVRTKENIERVRRDEEKAANEEKERQKRIALAEQEARTAVLRDRARKHRKIEDVSSSEDIPQTLTQAVVPHQHINFFSELEEKGNASMKNNKEYDAEKKAEKEKYEKSIGLLTYLGQSAAESQTLKPWYQKPPSKKKKKDEDAEKDRGEADQKKKDYLDPMHKMLEYVDKKKHKSHKKHKEKEKHKHKSKKYKVKSPDEEVNSPKPCTSTKTIEQLRAERLKREQQERLKAEKTMARLRGEKVDEEPEVITDDRRRGYNSQFNPELARKRKSREEYY